MNNVLSIKIKNGFYHLTSDEIDLRSPFIKNVPHDEAFLYESNSRVDEFIEPATEMYEYESGLAESEIPWWKRHRLMQKGDRGEDVGRLQKVLKIRRTNVYDDDTVKAVMQKQRRYGLISDGKVGPLTYAMIFHKDYEYAPKKPPIVKQDTVDALFKELYKALFKHEYEIAYTCWAACFESAIPTWKGRINFTIPSFLSLYKSYLDSRSAISEEGFKKVVKDFNGNLESGAAADFKIESVRRLLLQTKSHLIMVISIPPYVGHALVIYGFGVEGGDSYIKVMDPLDGRYKKFSMIDLNSINGTISIIYPNKVQ